MTSANKTLKDLLCLLADSGLPFVVVGGYAATLHGSSLITQDLDVCALLSPESIQKMRTLLAPYHPVHRMTPQKLPFLEHPQETTEINNLYIQTDLGQIDFLGLVGGVGDFNRVASQAINVEVFGRKCRVISLDDLVSAKKFMARPRDLETVKQLQWIRSKLMKKKSVGGGTDSTYWQEKWRNQDIRFHREVVHPALETYFRAVPKGTVLVPLCGKSLDLTWLLAEGHEVIGVELSSIACEAFFSENRLSYSVTQAGDFTLYGGDHIKIWCGDFFHLPAGAMEGVTAIYDRAALVALSAEQRAKYAEILSERQLGSPRSSVSMLLVTVEYPPETVQGPPFTVSNQEIKGLYNAAFDIEELYRQPDAQLGKVNPKFANIPVLEVAYFLNSKSLGSSTQGT